MKKVIFAVFVLIITVCVTLCAVHAEGEEEPAPEDEAQVVEAEETVEAAPEDEAQVSEVNETLEWIKKELVPALVYSLLAYFAYRITNRPLEKSNNGFAKDLLAMGASIEKNKAITEEQVKQLLTMILASQTQMQATADQMQKYDAEITSMRSIIVVLAEAVRVGLCNNPDLVKKGTAETICNLFNKVNLTALLQEENHEQDAA